MRNESSVYTFNNDVTISKFVYNIFSYPYISRITPDGHSHSTTGTNPAKEEGVPFIATAT